MKHYIGTKAVSATPMNLLDYNIYRGWELPVNQNGADEGYLVEYLDGGKPNHPQHDGYISWSPKEQFENAYQDTSEGMSFGNAVIALKEGLKVARKGWNGKGMFLYHVPEGVYPTRTEASKRAFGDEVAYGAYIAMKTAQDNVVPWLASQSDVLAEDWVLVK